MEVELDEGVFRVFHPRTGWRTLGSYAVEGDRITFFNDPQCHLAVGNFTWQRDDMGLRFALIDDNCELSARQELHSAGMGKLPASQPRSRHYRSLENARGLQSRQLDSHLCLGDQVVHDGRNIAVMGIVDAQLAVGTGAVHQHVLDHLDVRADA